MTAQPRPNRIAAAATMACIIAGAVLSWMQFGPLVALTQGTVIGGVVITAAVTGLIWWLMSRSVLWAPMGARPLAPFLWGGFGCMVIVALSAGATSDFAANMGWSAAEASLAGAWPEETGKLAGVALVLLWFAPRWHRPWDGLIAGIFTGLGFELIEDIQYASAGALDHADSDIAGFITLWVLRGIAGPGLHVFCTAIAGWGLGVAMLAPGLSTARRIGIAAGAFLAALVLHLLWNYQWSPAAGIAVQAVLWILGAGTVIALWVREARRIKRAAVTT